MEKGLIDELYFRRRRYGSGGGSLPWQTFTGNPLQFNAPKAHTLKSVKAEFSPVQDLHGQDAPWPAGGRANLFPTVSSGTVNGVTFTVAKDGTVTLNGLCSSSGFAVFTGSLKAGTYKINDFPSGTFPSNGNARTQVYDIVSGVSGAKGNNTDGTSWVEFSLTADSNSVQFRVRVDNGFNYQNATVKPMLALSTYSGGYSPYSNICPISGWTALDVFDEPDYDPTAQPMTTLSFGQTVYGGTAEVAEDGTATGSNEWCEPIDLGTLTWTFYSSTNHIFFCSPPNMAKVIDPPADNRAKGAVCSAYPASANTSISGSMTDKSWLRNARQLYIRDTRFDTVEDFADSVTGVKISYLLDTPVPFTVTASSTPTAVKGINTMWTDGSTLTVEAQGEAVNLNALQSLNMLLGGRYVNNHTAEDLTDEEALDILLGRNTK